VVVEIEEALALPHRLPSLLTDHGGLGRRYSPLQNPDRPCMTIGGFM
jgi:hypothetical protein